MLQAHSHIFTETIKMSMSKSNLTLCALKSSLLGECAAGRENRRTKHSHICTCDSPTTETGENTKLSAAPPYTFNIFKFFHINKFSSMEKMRAARMQHALAAKLCTFQLSGEDVASFIDHACWWLIQITRCIFFISYSFTVFEYDIFRAFILFRAHMRWMNASVSLQFVQIVWWPINPLPCIRIVWHLFHFDTTMCTIVVQHAFSFHRSPSDKMNCNRTRDIVSAGTFVHSYFSSYLFFLLCKSSQMSRSKSSTQQKKNVRIPIKIDYRNGAFECACVFV